MTARRVQTPGRRRDGRCPEPLLKGITMDFTAVIRAQVEIFSLGTEVDRTVCPSGSAVVSGSESRYHKNAFYPLERGFRYSPGVVGQLEAFYASRGRDGCLLDCAGEFS